METTNQPKPTPPYLTLGKLAKLVDLISSRKYSEITINHLSTYGFSKPNAYLAIATLRFLNLVDENGVMNNDLVQKFQLLGDQRKNEIAKIIKSSYSDLFKITENPQNLPIEDLTNEFLNIYKLTPRVAHPSVRCFLYFCEVAGLKEQTIKVREKASAPSEKNKFIKRVDNQEAGNKSGRKREMGDIEYFKFDFENGIQLLLPKRGGIDQIIAQGELKPVADEINSFIKKYYKSDVGQNNSEMINSEPH